MLLVQCHDMSVAESIILDNDVSETPDLNRRSSLGRRKSSAVLGGENRRRSSAFMSGESAVVVEDPASKLSLGPKGRARLRRRVQLSVTFAAIWGFGGSVNGSDRRKLFDGFIRDQVRGMRGNRGSCRV